MTMYQQIMNIIAKTGHIRVGKKTRLDGDEPTVSSALARNMRAPGGIYVVGKRVQFVSRVQFIGGPVYLTIAHETESK